MAAQEMCMGPILCRTRTGECCTLEVFEGRVICPLSCNLANRQTDVVALEGYSMQDIFQVTFLTSTLVNTFTSIFAPQASSTTATTTTSTTTSTTTTAPTITTSKLN